MNLVADPEIKKFNEYLEEKMKIALQTYGNLYLIRY